MASNSLKLVLKSQKKMRKTIDDFYKKRGQKVKTAMEAAVSLIYETARTPRSHARNLLGTKGTGASDPHAKFGVPVRTGNLRDSIHKKITVTDTEIIGKVYVDVSKAPYATFVEYGTSKMAARPFMRPALDSNREKIKQILNKA